MRIGLSPLRTDAVLSIIRQGETLIINGEPFDLSVIPEGATLPAEAVACEWIAGPVERIGGVLHVTITLPHGPCPPPEVAFPAPLIDPPDGELALPRCPDPEPSHDAEAVPGPEPDPQPDTAEALDHEQY